MIDACNPIGGGPPVNGVLSFFTPQNESLMERLQKAYPSAHFVKAFNSVGSGQMVNPEFAGGRPSMFICGNDETPRKIVREFSISSAGTRRIWARSRRRGQSRRSACCGAFPASERTTGRRTRSSFCGDSRALPAFLIARPCPIFEGCAVAHLNPWRRAVRTQAERRGYDRYRSHRHRRRGAHANGRLSRRLEGCAGARARRARHFGRGRAGRASRPTASTKS